MVNLSIENISKLVISAYDSIANEYTDAYSEYDIEDATHLKEFSKLLTGNCILDMGCGTGVYSSFLVNMGLDVFGIDASENMLIIANRIFPNIRFDNQNILHTSFSNTQFDGIVLSYVINHFNTDGLEQLRDEIDRILKPNGVIYISVHMGDSEEIVNDPLDASIKIYYNFLSKEKLDLLFSKYNCLYSFTRASFGESEFLCDKMFLIYRK